MTMKTDLKVTCFDCLHVMSWIEHGEYFVDCREGKMSEDEWPSSRCAATCSSFDQNPGQRTVLTRREYRQQLKKLEEEYARR